MAAIVDHSNQEKRITLTFHTIQASTKQDFSITGKTCDGKYSFLVVADGHGRWSTHTINYLRAVDWTKVISDDNFMERIIKDTNELRTRGEGSTLSVVRILDNHIIAGGHGDVGIQGGDIEVFFIGDSSVKIYCDGNQIYRTKDHDCNNAEEVKRIMETCNMRGIQRDGVWDIEVVDEETIKSVPSAIFDFGGTDTINMTNALGHNGRTGPILGYNKIRMNSDKTYKIVAGSDGFWGMTCVADHEFIAEEKQDATTLAEFAHARWHQKWKHDNTQQIVHNVMFPKDNIDDLCVAVALIKPLVL